MAKGVCKNEGCDQPVRCSELCSRCYARWLRTGEMGPPRRIYQPAKGRTCIIEGCDGPVRSKGMCSRHYDQSIRTATCPSCGERKDRRHQFCEACYRRNQAARHEESERTCTGCNATLPIEQFPWRPHETGWKRNSRCRACRNREARERTAALPKKKRQRRRAAQRARQKERLANDPEWALRRKIRQSCKALGLSFAEVMAAWEERGHQCEICNRTPAPGEIRLHIDHDHQTGAFRSFLCSGCNTGLGQLREDIAILRSAIEYLTRSSRREESG
jgi:hypothetical protein